MMTLLPTLGDFWQDLATAPVAGGFCVLAVLGALVTALFIQRVWPTAPPHRLALVVLISALMIRLAMAGGHALAMHRLHVADFQPFTLAMWVVYAVVLDVALHWLRLKRNAETATRYVSGAIQRAKQEYTDWTNSPLIVGEPDEQEWRRIKRTVAAPRRHGMAPRRVAARHARVRG